MIKSIAIAALLSATALVASPASAATLKISSPDDAMVRISIAGTSPAQLSSEIKAAAQSVCADKDGFDAECAQDAMADANDQLSMIAAGHRVATNVSVTRDGPESIRISLKDKSMSQIGKDIETAANTVCAGSNFSKPDLQACVEAAVSDARFQLRTIVARAGSNHELASR